MNAIFSASPRDPTDSMTVERWKILSLPATFSIARNIVSPSPAFVPNSSPLMPDRKRFPETPEMSLWALKRIAGDGAGRFDARKIASDQARAEGTALNFRP
jgi:hypothetical protein